MINLYLSSTALAAARAVDPQSTPAAVHAAVEVAVAEYLREVAGCSRAELLARADAILDRSEPAPAPTPLPAPRPVLVRTDLRAA